VYKKFFVTEIINEEDISYRI